MRPEQLAVARDRYHVLDVREKLEWNSGHIAGARHLPLLKVAFAGDVPRDQPLAVMCRSGHRSAIAARILRARGYDVENVEGGVEAWRAAGLALER